MCPDCGPDESQFESWRIKYVVLLSIISRRALVFLYLSVQWVPGVKGPERDAGYSSPSTTAIVNHWTNTSTPRIRIHDVEM